MPASALLLSALLASPPASANGQTTHVWITREALRLLPAGDLKTLLQANEDALVHGTMFPDGGYPLGHPYGEAAHWEPFQDRYLQWIRDNHGAPYSAEGARHVAFYMGLGSHGMADQHFDSCYLSWSRDTYDTDAGWADGFSMDEATDFLWAELTGPQDVPERWVPDTVLVDLFADHGIDVDEDTLSEGQGLLEVAIQLVGIGSQNPDFMDQYRAKFPWAGTHLEDDAVPGIPAYEAERVAVYWQEMWDRLDGRAADPLVSRTWPPDGGMGHPQDHTTPDAKLTVFFAEGLDPAEVPAERFTVVDTAGNPYAVSPQLYYGSDSHIVLLTPTEDWPPETDFVVTVSKGITSRYGTELTEDFTFGFSTTPPPVVVDTASPDAEDHVEDDGSDGSADGASDAGKDRSCGASGSSLLVFGTGLLGLGWRRRRTRG